MKSNVFSIRISKKSSNDTPLVRHFIALPAIFDIPQRPITGIKSTSSKSDSPLITSFTG